MKSLGIDYGDARIGVACSDALGMLAFPLETIHRQHGVAPEQHLSLLAKKHGCQTIVIGLPLHMDGSEGQSAGKVRAFAASLRELLPPTTEIAFVDERLSTVEAQKQLKAAGKKIRESKGILDQAAATLILQDWLDQKNGPESLLLPPE